MESTHVPASRGGFPLVVRWHAPGVRLAQRVTRGTPSRDFVRQVHTRWQANRRAVYVRQVRSVRIQE